MRRRSLLLAAVVVLAAAAPATATTASAASPTVLQSGPGLGGIRPASDVYTDRAGGIDAVWGSGVNRQTLRFARRAKGAKRFGRAVGIPRVAGSEVNYAAHIYEAGGELRILFRSEHNTYPSEWVARSRNHGRTWRLTELPAIDGGPQGAGRYGFYTRENSTIGADGTIRGMYGNSGAENLYTINPSLTRGTLLTPFETVFLSDEWVLGSGRSLWLSGRTDGGVGYRTPSGKTGIAPTAACTNSTIPTGNAMAVAHGRAVLFAAQCGHVYSWTLSASGRTGPRRRFGSASADLRTISAAYAHGRFRVAWVGADGDIRVASSRSGSAFTVARGAIPAAVANPSSTQQVYLDARGGSQVIWGDAVTPGLHYATASSSARVGVPHVSARGIPHVHRGHLGTFALAAPRVSLGALRKGRAVRVRVAVSATDTVTVTPRIDLPGASFPIGQAITVRLRPGHPRVLSFKADATYAATYFRKGRKVHFDVVTRNGIFSVGAGKLAG